MKASTWSGVAPSALIRRPSSVSRGSICRAAELKVAFSEATMSGGERAGAAAAIQMSCWKPRLGRVVGQFG